MKKKHNYSQREKQTGYVIQSGECQSLSYIIHALISLTLSHIPDSSRHNQPNGSTLRLWIGYLPPKCNISVAGPQFRLLLLGFSRSLNRPTSEASQTPVPGCLVLLRRSAPMNPGIGSAGFESRRQRPYHLCWASGPRLSGQDHGLVQKELAAIV